MGYLVGRVWYCADIYDYTLFIKIIILILFANIIGLVDRVTPLVKINPKRREN
jgi:hypothetical protein